MLVRNQADMNRRVRIPGADEHQGPMELRRQVLDAMREGAPDGYEESVRRYYEGLLR
jgi:DNA-binding FadR family transcriptional regulator